MTSRPRNRARNLTSGVVLTCVGPLEGGRSDPTSVFSRVPHYTHEHTSRRRGPIYVPPEKSGEDLFQLLSITSHLVWGRVVPDIPAFCRELIAALVEE
jgi:hypothetical protein